MELKMGSLDSEGKLLSNTLLLRGQIYLKIDIDTDVSNYGHLGHIDIYINGYKIKHSQQKQIHCYLQNILEKKMQEGTKEQGGFEELFSRIHSGFVRVVQCGISPPPLSWPHDYLHITCLALLYWNGTFLYIKKTKFELFVL